MQTPMPRGARAAACAAALLLAACGSGETDPGKVRFALTDAPACGFEQVNVSIERIRVNRKVPEKLEHAIEANKSLEQAEHRLIAETQADMARINKRFDDELERYRQLVSAGARPLLRTGEGGTR